jgi:LysM repeat protein
MKRFSFVLAAALLAVPVFSRGQDAATEERFNKLSAQIQDLIDAREAQNKRIEDLAKQVRDLQEKMDKPSGDYASAGDVKQLAAKLKEVDESRQHDNDLIVKKIEALGKTLSSASSRKSSTTTTPVVKSTETAAPTTSDKGIEYEIKPGDTLSAIVKACREQNVKVTVQQILDANPGLTANNLKVGKKIFIPAAAQ